MPSAIAASSSNLDVDAGWASAVAAYAELLRASPYVDPSIEESIATVISDTVYQSDSDRAEFVSLFEQIRAFR